WFTSKVTRVPKKPTVELAALDETQVPAFEYREPYFTEAFDKDWAARNRVVGASAHLDESTGGTIRYADFVHSFDRLIPPGLYDNCKALAAKYGGQSGAYIWFVNQVAEAIDTDPATHDMLIDTLAYQFTEAPPKDIAPRKNVRVRLCPINVCEGHAYEKDDYP